MTEKKARKQADIITMYCVSCGRGVETRSRKLEFCADCAKRRKASADAAYKASKRPPHKLYECKRCEKTCEYEGRVPKRYCAECKEIVTKETMARHDAKRRKPLVIGSIACCEKCSTQFEKRGSNHLFCDECAPLVKKERIKQHAIKYPERRKASAKRYNDKRRSTPQGRLEWTMRVAVRRAVAGSEFAGKRTFDVLGYTVEELKAHLEKQFKDGMSWSNYGPYWHIDHIIPLAAHNYTTTECPEFKAAWALTNLQPLPALENMSKGAKVLQLL
jgi:hypothetical protein